MWSVRMTKVSEHLVSMAESVRMRYVVPRGSSPVPCRPGEHLSIRPNHRRLHGISLFRVVILAGLTDPITWVASVTRNTFVLYSVSLARTFLNIGCLPSKLFAYMFMILPSDGKNYKLEARLPHPINPRRAGNLSIRQPTTVHRHGRGG